MPNHCENDLWIRGEKANVDAVLLHIGAYKPEPQFDFNTIIPYPDPFKSMDDDAEAFGYEKEPRRDDPEREYKRAEMRAAKAAYVAKWGTSSDGFNSGGIEWRREHWGTKWNAYDVARRDYDGHVCLTFQTAWAPPIPVIVALAKIFPKVTLALEYFERGMEFAGGFEIPSEDNWYDDDRPWRPGTITDEWRVEGYKGVRGG
jgi:hypothetical protein